jgi:addiction module RelE/StbE family toxin
MNVAWARRAKSDLRKLVAYIAEDSIQGAELVATRILEAAKSLAKMPRIGRTGRIPGTRERVVGRAPYILVYKIASGRVRILRVYHGAQEWPAGF